MCGRQCWMQEMIQPALSFRRLLLVEPIAAALAFAPALPPFFLNPPGMDMSRGSGGYALGLLLQRFDQDGQKACYRQFAIAVLAA